MPRSLRQDEIDSFREELCRVATRRFAEAGYAGVTLRGLAREAGCSPMTPYRYFANRGEILAAVRAAAFGRLADRCEEAAASTDEPLERLHAVCEASVAFARKDPHAYRIVFDPDPAHLPDDPEAARHAKRARRVHLDAAQAAVRSGSLHGEPVELANLLRAGAHGVVALHLADELHGAPAVAGLARAMTERLIRAFRPGDPASLARSTQD